MSDKLDTRYREPRDNPVSCMTIRQHFALEIYKAMIAGRDSYIGSDEYVTQDSYSLAIDAADGLLAQLEKDEK